MGWVKNVNCNKFEKKNYSIIQITRLKSHNDTLFNKKPTNVKYLRFYALLLFTTSFILYQSVITFYKKKVVEFKRNEFRRKCLQVSYKIQMRMSYIFSSNFQFNQKNTCSVPLTPTLRTPSTPSLSPYFCLSLYLFSIFFKHFSWV